MKLRKLSEVLAANPNIIINTDIDGFLSGMILQRYCNANIVGFSNSKKDIWVADCVQSIYDPIYVDLYVNRPDVVCIEQHIIAFNHAHHDKIVQHGTKFNPNLERGRTFAGDLTGSYYQKYPFGTVHYLITLLAREGIEVALPDLYAECSTVSPVTGNKITTNMGHILMRADDALNSSLSAYAPNAMDWWKFLTDTSNGSTAVEAMIQFVQSCDKNKSWQYKNDIGAFFTNMGCSGTDGAFDNIVNSDGTMMESVRNFYTTIKEFMGLSALPPLPVNLRHHTGVFDKMKVYDTVYPALLDQDNLYSYAFIFGPTKNSNFSYTLDMTDEPV